jgi:hypothetical protein
VHRIKMAIELQRGAGITARVPDDNGGGGRMASGGAFDGKAVRAEQISQQVGNSAGFACATLYRDEPSCGVDESPRVDCTSKSLTQG